MPRETVLPAESKSVPPSAGPQPTSHSQASSSTSAVPETIKIPTDLWQGREELDLPVIPHGFKVTADTVIALVACPNGLSVPDDEVTSVVMWNREKTKRELFERWPTFPMAFSTPSPPRYKIDFVEGFGLSMIATTNIARGQLIVRQRPLLLFPQAIPDPELLASLVNGMPPSNRAAVYALTNARGPELSHLHGIMSTNCMLADGLPGYDGHYSALARDISRINHSCSPNAAVVFDLATVTQAVRALHPIRAGEQVTMAYIYPNTSRVLRQKELRRRYRFECKCTSCSKAPRESYISSDLKRVVLALRHEDEAMRLDEEAFQKWLAQGAPIAADKNTIPPIQSLSLRQLLGKLERMNGFERTLFSYNAMKDERWYPVRLSETILARLVKAYSVLEKEGEVRKYALEAAMLRKVKDDSDGGWAEVVRHPRHTDWWGRRVNLK